MPSCRFLFFTVWGDTTKLERASLDGRQRKILIYSNQFVHPSSLTLDYANEHIYWADVYLGHVGRVNYDGSDRKLIYQSSWVSLLSEFASE